MRGIFAWVTCPYILERFNQENESYGTGIEPLPIPDQSKATASSDKLLLGDKKQQIMLEEYTFTIQENAQTKKLAEILSFMISGALAERIKDHLVVLPNDDFTDFALLSTEVNARIHINTTTGIVDKGALWYEENVPPETFFYSYLFAGEPRRNELYRIKNVNDVLQFMMNEDHFPEVFQLGGNSTLGRGLIRRIWMEGSK
jgi:CRISPR-associated protein Cmr4